jgi:hypothetical protein
MVAFLFMWPILLLTTCKDEVTRTRTFHTMVPYYISVSDLRAQVITAQEPRELSVPGKIYIYGNYLFITEVNKGIHIVDNTNPASPRFINFINIAGNGDLAVNSNILYADNYVDLLAFDVTNPAHIIQVRRVENVFEKYYIDKAKGLIVGYKDTVITQVINDQSGLLYNETTTGGLKASSSGNAAYGTGGSTARFTLMNSNLYAVDSYSLKLFNVSDPSDPKYSSTINLGWGIETIFPYENKLFIGSTTGMHIYDASVPSAPVKLSTYQHVTSCDPVVVQGKYAYVTLRSDNFCRQGVNMLQVLNIEDPRNPVMVSSFPMLKPYGLTITNTSLFICEGKYGFKAFDSSDALTVGQKQLSFLKDIDASDVIAGPKSLIITGVNGIYQYEYANPSQLKLLSHLSLSNTL